MVQKNDYAGELVYKTIEDAIPAASEDTDWSGWEKWLQGHLAIESRRLIDGIAEGTTMLIREAEDRVRSEFRGEISKLWAENAELKGRVDTLVRLLQAKSADLVSLAGRNHA
jgi:hypothetical protein